MCCAKTTYRGFIIYKNISEDFGTPYWSIYNPQTRCHVHTNGGGHSREIVNCAYNLERYNISRKHSRITKNKALVLLGFKVRYR